MLKIDIQNMQIHQHKWTCRKKHKFVCQFHYQFRCQFQKPPFKPTKVLSPLEEGECIVDFCQITTTIYKHLVNMGLGEDISFDKFLTNMCLNEETYIFSINMHITKTHIVFLMPSKWYMNKFI